MELCEMTFLQALLSICRLGQSETALLALCAAGGVCASPLTNPRPPTPSSAKVLKQPQKQIEVAISIKCIAGRGVLLLLCIADRCRGRGGCPGRLIPTGSRLSAGWESSWAVCCPRSDSGTGEELGHSTRRGQGRRGRR